MGVFYNIYSASVTKDMVNNNDYAKIDDYIQNPQHVKNIFDDHPYRYIIPLQVSKGYEWIDGAYQIASRAVELGNKDVLHHIKDKICFDYIRDGNTYNLFVLATEKHQFHMIDQLWEIALNNGFGENARDQLQYSIMRLMGYSYLSEEEALEHLSKYTEKENILLNDVYNYSNKFDKLLVKKWLEDNYSKDRLKMKVVPECNHTLEFTDKGYIVSQWLCNKCGKDGNGEEEGKRWYCKICNNDVCVECQGY